MAYRRSPTQRRRWIGYLVEGMAGTVAVAPLALALAIPSQDGSAVAVVSIIAALLWMLAVVTYRGLSRAHESWRRRMLTNEIADIRRARLDASEAFQQTLHAQIASLDRIVDIADSLLTAGIIDPITALENVRMVASHANEARGVAEAAIAEVRIETGATSFEMRNLDVRDEIEAIAAPFIRAGHNVSTGGNRCLAHTDPAALRIIIRGLISRAIERGAQEIDVTVARDGERIVCTVADSGPDRATADPADIPRVPLALATAIGTDIEHGYTLGWNRYGLALPAISTVTEAASIGDRPPLPRLSHNAVIEFTIGPDPEQWETVAGHRKEPLEAR